MKYSNIIYIYSLLYTFTKQTEGLPPRYELINILIIFTHGYINDSPRSSCF